MAHTHVDQAHTHDYPGPGHAHPHDHHGHSHVPAASVENWRPLTLALVLNAVLMVVEFAAGLWTQSLALLSDAGHLVTDVGALGLALFALWFSRRAAPRGLTFGYLRFEILAALINGVTLLGITGFIFVEAWHRLHAPPEIHSREMLAVAILGLLVNLWSVWILSRGGGHSLNERGALLHMIGDALSSVGTVVAALVMLYSRWPGRYLADPIASGIIGLLILRSTWELLRETVNILMEGTPIHLSFEEVRMRMLDVPGVADVKDLHLWCLASGFDALSAHVVVPETGRSDEVRGELKRILREQFRIEHSTLEIQRPGETPECPPGLEGRCGALTRET